MLYSKVNQLYIYIHILFNIPFHGLSQDIEYSFLCYTVGPCFLSILYIIVWKCLLVESSAFGIFVALVI